MFLQLFLSWTNLHNYFDIHVCLSLRRPSVRRPASRPTFEFQIPAGVWQSVFNKSWLVCVKSDRYVWIMGHPQTPLVYEVRKNWAKYHYIIRKGEAKVGIWKLTSAFYYLFSFCTMQLCVLAVFCYVFIPCIITHSMSYKKLF